MKKLDSFKKKRVSLDELYDVGYSDIDIHKFIETNKLTPVKNSGTNGNLRNPLFKKYNIVTEQKDYTDLLSEINKLHPKLTANSYLIKHPENYNKYKDIISSLDAFFNNKSELCNVSRRERSLLIFNDEKVLDDHISLIQSLGLTDDDLAFYTTPEQCFPDYIPIRKNDMTLLVCENKDIWFNIRRLMTEDSLSEIFGVHIDGIIFGQGNDITGKDKFFSYARYLSASKVDILYCGDIDRAGFDIFCRLCNEASMLNIRLFVPIYQKMLELADIDRLPDSDDNRNIDLDYTEFLYHFSSEEQDKIKNVFDKGKRLPQEIINYIVLKENMR